MWWLWLTIVMYAAAVIIVFFYDTRADLYPGRYVPKTDVSWWGYLWSWIKQAAGSHFVLSTLSLFWTWTCFIFGKVFPMKPLDLQAHHRKRLQDAMSNLQNHTHSGTRLAYLMAAANIHSGSRTSG